MALIAVIRGKPKRWLPPPPAITSTMQIVEYHVKYSTATDQNPPDCCGGGKGKPKKKPP